MKLASAIFLIVYAPISVKGDSPFWKRDACRHRQHACLYWFWDCGLEHREDTPTSDIVLVYLQQGGSQHVISARGILSSGRPKETNYNK